MRVYGVHNIQNVFVILVMACLCLLNASPAYALNYGFGASCGGPDIANTLGGMICNLANEFYYIPSLLDIISYILGLGFMVYGITRAVKHVDSPSQVPISDPIKMIMAAAFFLTAPTFMWYVIRSFGIDEAYSVTKETGFFDPVDPEATGTIDSMLGSFAANVYDPMLFMFSVFTYIAGVMVLLTAIHRITKGFDQGPKGPLGLGTMMHFVTASALIAAPQMLGVLSESIFGTASIKTFVGLGSMGMDQDITLRAQSIITSIELFLIIIGIISFIRGWFLLKSAADGSGQASMLQAFTHIIAGVVAVNIGPFMNAVQKTFNITSYDVIFH